MTSMQELGGETGRELAKATIVLEEAGGVGQTLEFIGGQDATALMALEQQSEPDAEGKVSWTLRLTRVQRVEPEQEQRADDELAGHGANPAIEALKAGGMRAADVRAPRLP